MSAQVNVNRLMMPHMFEVLWVLALVTKDKPDALASEVYEEAFRHGRPSYQNWTPQKIATVLKTLRRRGLVENSQATDEALPAAQTRRWWISEKGWTVLNP